MFRITDFTGHFLGGEGGGIKIKLIEQRCAKYAKSVKKNFHLKNSNVNMLSTSPIILFSEQILN